MKNSVISLLCALTAMLLGLSANTLACTDFRITAKDGTVLIARSMEFDTDLQSNLRTSPRGRAFTSPTPEGKTGLSWKAKYGYLFLDGFNVDVAIDGMNEQGLSIESLYLPGLAEYQTVPSGSDKQALSYAHFGDWILGNFKTVDEVRQALPSVYVFAQKLPGFGDMIFPLHYAIYDATGKSIIVEYIGGKLNIHDNKIGVLTNSPTYDWHLTNLNNYVHLRPVNPSPVVDAGVKFASAGQGFGMIGLPGDISPPSRFIKIAVLTDVAFPAIDATGAINLAEHIINNVDIPHGLVRDVENGHASNEFTQWVVFKDLTHKVFYYRTYSDMSLRAVSLAQVDLSENATRLKMSIASNGFVQDMTKTFSKAVGK